MTELLYHHDSYLRRFDARVLRVEGERVRLDRTAFYPTGGGQPHDVGWLLVGDAPHAPVTEVRREDGAVWHTALGHRLEPGARVTGEIDWERRHRLMRTHTALHVLCGVIWRDHAAPVTGSQMEPLRARMDFELVSMRADFVHALERAVADEITADRRIEVRTLPRAEAEKIPDLVRTKVNLLPPDMAEIRIVDIVGLDLQADGGTHVRSTREVGRVRIVDYRSKGKANKRLVVEIDDA
jgi:misacylated tRNA(Ala) deacylase